MSQFKVTIKDGIATILNSRPEVLNSMLTQTWAELNATLEELSQDASVRVAVITGDGTAFCSGADVRELKKHTHEMAEGTLSTVDMRNLTKLLQDSTRRLRAAPFPVIAAIHGYAVGAGLEMTCACDLIVAEEGAVMGFPEANVAVNITNGGTFFASRVFGLNKAREMAYTGEFITAEEGYRLGAVSRIAPKGKVLEEATKLAQRIASRAPLATRMHKRLFDTALESSLENTLFCETEGMVVTGFSADHQEGTTAFVEKREPKFTGT